MIVNNRPRLYFAILPVLCIITAALFSADASASKTATAGQGAPATSSCTTTGTTFCGQYGVSWRYYSISNNAFPTAQTTCRDDADTDGYYVLAYEWVKVTKDAQGHTTVNYLNEQVLNRDNKYVHVNQVNIVTTGGYKFLYPGDHGISGNPGGKGEPKAWDDVKAEWVKYQNSNGKINGYTWNDATWFCGDEHPEPQKGLITAESGIKVNGVGEERTGAKIGPKSTGLGVKDKTISTTVNTSQSSISGEIFHKIYYENADPNWDNVRAKDKKYDFDLDLLWCTADGDQTLPGTACDVSSSGDSGIWSVAAKKKSDATGKVGKKGYTLAPGQSYCQTLSPDPLKFTFNATSKGKDPDIEEAGTGNTTACVQVNHVDKPTDPKDEFWATSSVWVPDAATETQLNGYDPGKHTSDKDAAVGLKVSTDNDTLQFSFSHLMSYDVADYWHNMWRNWNSCKTTGTNSDGSTYCIGGWDYYDKPTALSYELTGDTAQVTENSKDEVSQYTAGKTETDAEGNQSHSENKNVDVASYTYTISGIQPGETKKVCHKITYNPKYYVTPVSERLVWKGQWTVGPDWVYGTPTGSGSEDSEACIEITRPADPPEGGGDPDPYGPKIDGKNNADIMYAGEHTNVGWNVTAKSVPTRRVIERKAVGFVVKSNIENASVLEGTIGKRVNSDPCTYFENQLGGKDKLISYNGATCSDFSGSYEWTGFPAEDKEYSYNQTTDIAVPDNVGGKYCNSYGYRWGYWWGVAKADTSSGLTDDITSWNYVADKDYWTNYSPACRTIAKKPSMAIWNGSLFSGGGVISSTAPRHDDARTGQPVKMNDDSSKTTYGSWAENLVVASNDVNKFASSGAYGGGLHGLVEGNDWDMAWQTISNQCLIKSNPACLVQGFNDGTLGNSGINYNSSYNTRLAAYLKNSKEEQNASTFSGEENVAETKLYYFNPSGGTLTIAGNVTLTDNVVPDQAQETSIYEMPQVVIYVEGDVKIAPDVTRLDAWIIATGKVNTCDGWKSNETQTQSQHYNQNATCDKPLQINGPVIAGSVILNRTYGADNLTYGLGDPGKYTSSEVFNLSALTYLWSFAQAGRYNSSYTDVYARELAPRY